ncbi:MULTISPECIES: hypothetical protein [unclassified Methanobrevibacter]|jgi:hypothetical protein|uniref:hypothetical protein n=1 Tax=unclassified Methanobrevibacter TaxID=2638681 RepID=UPI0039B93C14
MFVDSDVTGVVFVSEANARGREIKAIMETNNKENINAFLAFILIFPPFNLILFSFFLELND